MPKKLKLLTSSLYVYVKPENAKFAKEYPKKHGYESYSQYVDSLINSQRLRHGRKTRAEKAADAAADQE